MESIHFVPIFAPRSVSFSLSLSSVFWSIPQLGTIKINVDAVVFESSRHFVVGVGVVACNNLGIVFTPFIAELFAFSEGIMMALQNR